ncbi:hypothetical protein NDGK_02157 [Clostridiales bacterium CHKCI001]|nr:hypothetical protein NDGK_02157 [Clostridiales bacterium CHKCI001]
MEVPYRGSGEVYLNEKEYQCDLYYNEKQGGIILKIRVKNKKALGSFLQVPLELLYLCGQLENGFKFTLLRLNRIKMEDLLSYGTTVFTFNAEYILCGIDKSTKHEQTFYQVNFTLSNIIEWGEESVYTVGEHCELIRRSDDVRKPIYKGQDITINYVVYGSMLPVVNHQLLKEHIDLEQNGIIEIFLEKEANLEKFIQIFESIKKLIEIASIRKINVEKVSAYSHEIVYSLGDKTIERSIEVYGKDIQENKNREYFQNHRWKWISLSELIAQNSFEYYFDKHEMLAPIIELFLEPFYVEESSETRIFLNIVQALETYHSRFVTNDINEFKARVEKMVNSFCSTEREAIHKFLMANSKRFITLESRIADLLLANREIYFDIGEIKRDEFPAVIAHTRNYYIHYDERIKEKHRVLAEEELQFYNRSLLQILEYYILLEIGFSDSVALKSKITERWGRVSQDMEILRISRERNDSQT